VTGRIKPAKIWYNYTQNSFKEPSKSKKIEGEFTYLKVVVTSSSSSDSNKTSSQVHKQQASTMQTTTTTTTV